MRAEVDSTHDDESRRALEQGWEILLTAYDRVREIVIQQYTKRAQISGLKASNLKFRI